VQTVTLPATAAAIAVGYLFGSISFARLVARILGSKQPIGATTVEVPDSQVRLEYDAISATTIRLSMGPGYGCLTSLLDMLKAAIPVLAIRLWQPDYSYHLFVAAAATAGHNWPIYHRFKGGRGMSPILGGMIVVDWLGVLASNCAALLLGVFIGDFSVTDKLGFLLMIPWLWFRHHDAALTAYAVIVNAMLWIAMIPELRQLVRLRRNGTLQTYTRAERVRVGGTQNDRQISRLTAAGLLSLILSRLGLQSEESTDDL
jgi:glycerol-3-phosphate acyltransferase PlsY